MPVTQLTPQVLKDEITRDPAGLGFSQYLRSMPDGSPDVQAITNLLNDPSRRDTKNNALPAFPIALEQAPLFQAVAYIDGAEFKALAPEDRQYLQLLASAGPMLLLKDATDPTFATDTPAWSYIKTLFPAGKPTRASIDRVAYRAGSRAEALSGVPHTSASVQMVQQALAAS